MSRRNRTIWVVGLVVTLFVAGVISWYASSSPDGLEWAAEQSGFLDTAEDSAATGSPLADYQLNGADSRLSGGVAGVVGVVAVLVVAGSLTWALRRRGRDAATVED